MQRAHLLGMLLGIAIHSLGGMVAYADITGSFQTRVSLTPFSCARPFCEKAIFTVDFELRLQLAMALEGVTLEIEGALGGIQLTACTEAGGELHSIWA